MKDAQNQLDTYKNTEYFKDRKDLKSWLIIFASDKPIIIEER